MEPTMATDLQLRVEITEVPVLKSPGDDVLHAWLAGRNANTAKTYAFALEDFARYVRAASPGAAVDGLLAMGRGNANRVVIGFKAHLVDRQLATGTIASRIGALRSMVNCARKIGRVEWMLDVESPRVEKYRDTTGPGHEG
jgi:integrase/recombinase XerC